MNNETARIQKRLAFLGYDPGPIDGRRGRRTIRAVRAFQRANGLTPDGIVGPLTSAALSSPTDRLAVHSESPPWIAEARWLLGTQEIPGPRSNPRIIDWAESFDLDYGNDDIPWCGLFVAHCIGSQLPDEVLPANVLLARAWTGFGREVTPRPGALLVFWRGSRNGWSGHVGFHVGASNGAYRVLGVNQGNKVSVAPIAADRLLGAYWPLTWTGSSEVVLLDSTNGTRLSENEA